MRASLACSPVCLSPVERARVLVVPLVFPWRPTIPKTRSPPLSGFWPAKLVVAQTYIRGARFIVVSSTPASTYYGRFAPVLGPPSCVVECLVGMCLARQMATK